MAGDHQYRLHRHLMPLTHPPSIPLPHGGEVRREGCVGCPGRRSLSPWGERLDEGVAPAARGVDPSPLRGEGR